jgi:hypothetical protein
MNKENKYVKNICGVLFNMFIDLKSDLKKHLHGDISKLSDWLFITSPSRLAIFQLEIPNHLSIAL